MLFVCFVVVCLLDCLDTKFAFVVAAAAVVVAAVVVVDAIVVVSVDKQVFI